MIKLTFKDNFEALQANNRYACVCDRCGKEHFRDTSDTPDAAVMSAAMSGWHVASLMPNENWRAKKVTCPQCWEFVR